MSAPATYWCHQCHRTVRPRPGNDLVCPSCNGGFIEEVENTPEIFFPAQRDRSTVVFGGEPGSDARRDTREPSADSDGAAPGGPFGLRLAPVEFSGGGAVVTRPPIFQVLEAMSAILQQSRQDQIPEGGGVVVDPMTLVQNMFGGRGGNIEVFFDTGNGNGARRLPANLGDYFFGPGLDQLIQQLAENDPNRYGTPPASKSAIDAMPTISIGKEHMGTDAAQCAVCKDEFELGSQVRQMPCKHLYHGDCILPWLTQHNSCPVCRFEMPTDDPEYSNNANTGQSSQNSGGAMNSGAGAGRARGFSIWGSPRGGSFSIGTEGDAGQQAGATGVATGAATPPGHSRRGSFHFPWPFRSSSSPPPASPASNPQQEHHQQQHQQQQQQQQGSNSGNQPPADDNMRHDLLD